MPTRREWLARQKQAQERKPLLRIDRVHITSLGPEKGYEVVIEGFNLRPSISPPSVRVGQVLAENLIFEKEGRVIRGLLREKPRDSSVVVDYGFAGAELKDESSDHA